MFQSFLTAVDSGEGARRQRRQVGGGGGDRVGKLREAIRGMVGWMAPWRELCAQAAVNIGLPGSLLDFEKILKAIAGEDNLATLTSTSMQLATLQKQCAKLKKTIVPAHPTALPARAPTRNNTRQDTLPKPAPHPNDDPASSRNGLLRAMEEEMAFRIKVRNMRSGEQLEKKEEILKKRVEKAKSMNKRALKIYKNHKQKEEQSYDFFTVQPQPATPEPLSLNLPPNLHERKFIPTLKDSPREGLSSRDNSPDLLKVSILRSSYVIPSEKSKTAATRLRVRYNEQTTELSELSKTTNERFVEYRRREAVARTKKEEMERSKEEQALYRFIKKNERLAQLEQQSEKEQEQQSRKLQQTGQQTVQQDPIVKPPLPSDPPKDDTDFQIRRETHLQEQVNRIREELRTKEERRQRHKLQREREQEYALAVNEQYLQSYAARCRTLKQNEYRHEMTIKRRHQQLQQKENDQRAITGLAKLTDQQLLSAINQLTSPDPRPFAF